MSVPKAGLHVDRCCSEGPPAACLKTEAGNTSAPGDGRRLRAVWYTPSLSMFPKLSEDKNTALPFP